MFDGKKNLLYETEVPQVKTIKMVVFWDVMLCTLLDHISSILKIGAVFTFEMLIITQLSNEICPTVKLHDFILFYYYYYYPPPLITDLKSIVRYHLNFLRNRHI